MSPYDTEEENDIDELDGLQIFEVEGIEIENRTRAEVFHLLKEAGFRRDSRNWGDYIRAKQLLFPSDVDYDSATHAEQLDLIVEYFGL